MEQEILPGSLVNARGRTWVVQTGSESDWLKLRPVGGTDDEITELIPALERLPVTLASFPAPNPADVGNFSSARLLYHALRFQLRSGAGAFRSFGSISVEPRPYQLVPLLMAMRMPVVRLLIADDVGVGKTVETGLIIREMMDRGEIETLAVLCPPHLVEQWVTELKEKFNISAQALTSASAARLERDIPHGRSLIDQYPVLVISLDYIKNKNHRDYFQTMRLDCIVVDEAHTCSQTEGAKQLRFELLQRLSENKNRHMIFLTATPHSGKNDAYFSLLSLLDPEFLQMQGKEIKANDPLRQKLARHFVQRRRKDIDEWKQPGLDRPVGFPTRKVAEITYQLDSKWSSFFSDIQDYCSSIIDQKGEENHLIWYAVLALFRCVSSSPRSAVQALKNRGEEYAAEDEFAESDEITASDVEPITAVSESSVIEDLISKAQALEGPKNDPKLKVLLSHLQAQINEGFNPVVFCRYIATAEYLDEQIRTFFKGQEVTIDTVTGDIGAEERKAKVEELGEAKRRILVATDCLSEGINLQEYFSAVIHYDLAWNPTRHEQREGRVDRFGQKASEIRCTMIYGENNPVDGFILRVILRKSQEIRKSLGVTVPIPENTDYINKALIEAALFKKKAAPAENQLQLGLFSDEPPEEKVIETVWKDALKQAKGSATVFAQRSIHPDDVYPICKDEQEKLGSHEDVVLFCKEAFSSLGAPLETTGKPNLFKLNLQRINNGSVKQRFVDEGFSEGMPVDFDTIHRASNLVNCVSEAVMNEAFEPQSDKQGLIKRSAVATSPDVASVTRIYILRLRYQMRAAYRNQTRRIFLAEEIVPLVYVGNKNPKEIPQAEGIKLLSGRIGGNILRNVAENQIKQANSLIQSKSEEIEALAQKRSEELKEEHKKIREYTAEGSVVDVKPCTPVDVMGCFVILPEDE
jgi:superfamily II DNA or RNA helicase